MMAVAAVRMGAARIFTTTATDPHALHPINNTAIHLAYKIFLHSTAAKLSAMLITFPDQ